MACASVTAAKPLLCSQPRGTRPPSSILSVRIRRPRRFPEHYYAITRGAMAIGKRNGAGRHPVRGRSVGEKGQRQS